MCVHNLIISLLVKTEQGNSPLLLGCEIPGVSVVTKEGCTVVPKNYFH